VCELCAPRAVHEGWQRETDQPSLTLPPLRPRRARGLLDRLRQVARPGDAEAPRTPAERAAARRSDSYDIFDEPGGEDAAGAEALAQGETPAGGSEPPPAPSVLDHAVMVFNASEYPRRVAGVARSLGAPAINVRSAEHLSTVVRIAVAWELCWYRYEVDLSEEGELLARARGQGTELSELDREELEANAFADEAGAISLTQ
jgi:hypothetical protein